MCDGKDRTRQTVQILLLYEAAGSSLTPPPGYFH